MATTKTYYHVAPASYRVGDDLWCYDELVAQGYEVAWKWEDAEEGFDTDVVCLFSSRDDAESFVAEFLSDGQVLTVDLSDAPDVRLTTVAEGFPAAFRRIPALYISVE
jgi:hypothetical protein